MSKECFKTVNSRFKSYQSPYVTPRVKINRDNLKKRIPVTLKNFKNINFKRNQLSPKSK